jgi:hypothetical protein
MTGIWSDLAAWGGPTPNKYPGGMADVAGLALHIQQGTQAGSLSWCRNPASYVSAHFFNGRDGSLVQLVSTDDAAWAEVGGNRHWISVENEGYSGDSLTDAQLQNCARLLARCHTAYGVPLQSCNAPVTGRGLTGHSLGGTAWGGHADCPGPPVLAQRGEIISRAALIIASLGGPVSLTPADLEAIKLAVWGYKNPGLDPIDMRQRLVNAEAAAEAALALVQKIAAAPPVLHSA